MLRDHKQICLGITTIDLPLGGVYCYGHHLHEEVTQHLDASPPVCSVSYRQAYSAAASDSLHVYLFVCVSLSKEAESFLFIETYPPVQLPTPFNTKTYTHTHTQGILGQQACKLNTHDHV